MLECALSFHCTTSGDSPSSKGDKSLSFHISSSTAAQIIILFPACLILLCVSFVFFSVMQTHTSFLVPTFLLVSLCLWLAAHLDMPALSSLRGKHQEFLKSRAMHLCVTLFLFWVTARVPHTSHTTFPPEITCFLVQLRLMLINLCSSQPFPKSFYCLFFACSNKWCHFGLAAGKEDSGCSPQCHWLPLQLVFWGGN